MKNSHFTISNYRVAILIPALFLLASFSKAYGQAEMEASGNMTGIRKHGQLFDFKTYIRVIGGDGQRTAETALQRQHPHFRREGSSQTVNTAIDSLYFKEKVRDRWFGGVKVKLRMAAHKDTAITGIQYCINLPGKTYANAKLRFIGVNGPLKEFTTVADHYDQIADGVELRSATDNFSIKFNEPARVIIKKDTVAAKNDLKVYIALQNGGVRKGHKVGRSFIIHTGGDIDNTSANLTINTTTQGRPFLGLGGNFRLQNPKYDPEVIDYCLQNLRVAYGRVELPWRYWQPYKDVDPTLTSDSGKLALPVVHAMQMAHRLDSMGIPVVLTAWFPPDWAASGKVNFQPVNGIWGNALNADNMDAIYRSIAGYILYLKNKYGFEPELFSFNESDLGINVRATPQQHDDFIKGCGAYFAAHGISTKLLLGDNSNATTYQFIYPALNDPDARQYIGAISFHSWSGWTTEILEKWADAAAKIDVPLLVGEGSIDAAAHSYPQIFQEQTYALQEINLYTRLLAICQPLSILQWQLTSDYSPLIGGGIYGNDQPLHPGQRFFNLKQLSSTPAGLFAMPISCDKTEITAAALGDNEKGAYAIHLVNNGAKRTVTLSGLPAKVKAMRIYTTNKKLDMKEGDMVKVANGKTTFTLESAGFTTLISE